MISLKINKIILVFLILSSILFLGAVSANDDNLDIDEISLNDDSEEIIIDDSPEVLSLSDEVIGEGESIDDGDDEINVEVTNVFKGHDNTVKVVAHNKTGNVNIAVGDKSYTAELIDGVATQIISNYSIGINNVTIKYNNITKNTYFKGLDGIVTYKTFYDYFDENNEYNLQGYIPNGITLDFQGNITYINLNKTEDFNMLSILINKPVNIISSTKDAFIDFNGKAGSLLGEYPGSTFSILKGGSWSNVTGIIIHNTQLWIFNTHHVTLDNISVIVEDARIGSGVGATSVRANSTWCTVKNSYFYTRNNGGSSSLVMAWADYCTFYNNTVVVEGNVGNMIYTTTYNVNIPIGVSANAHNKIINNRLFNAGESSAICYGICVSGNDTLVENNTCTYKGVGIVDQWGDSEWGYNIVPGKNKYINNVLNGCSLVSSVNSIAYNNKVYSDMTIIDDCSAYNNYVSGTFFIKGNNVVLDNNTVKKLSISGNNITITNTFALDDSMLLSIEGDNVNVSNMCCGLTSISGSNNMMNNSLIKNNVIISGSNNIFRNNTVIGGTITVQSSGNLISDNNVSSTKNFAVELKKTGNTVMNNYLLCSNSFADAAVRTYGVNTIKDNYPFPPTITINVESVDRYENMVTVAVPNVTGSVTIKVSDKTYSLTLTDGKATQRISGLDPGNYTLTVDYKDDKSPIYSSNSTTIVVPKIDVYDFGVKQNEFMEGHVIIPISLPGDAHEGRVIVDNMYAADVVNGSCNVTVLGLVEGEYDLSLNYTGGQRYEDKSIRVHIKIIHNPQTTLKVSDISTYYMVGRITAELTDYDSKPIANATIIFNGKTEVKTNDLGIAEFDYNLAVGNNKVLASFKGNENYNSSAAEATIKVLSRFTSNKNIQMNYYDGTKYQVRVIGDNGKPVGAGQVVVITINGKPTNVKTDKNGYAALTITNTPKTYAITASYKGQTVKNTVKVAQNLKTSKVTVKKSAKKLVLKATLSKVKGKKLTFKFNGKKYTAKTDKKGVAKVTLNKNVIKKLKKGKKYTFTVTYVSNTIKNQVIVK